VRLTQHSKTPHNARMVQLAAGIFTLPDIGTQAVFRNGKEHVGIRVRGYPIHIHSQLVAAGDRYLGFRLCRRFGDCFAGFDAIATDKLRMPIHYHLRRVDTIVLKRVRVIGLPLTKTVSGKRIAPSLAGSNNRHVRRAPAPARWQQVECAQYRPAVYRRRGNWSIFPM